MYARPATCLDLALALRSYETLQTIRISTTKGSANATLENIAALFTPVRDGPMHVHIITETTSTTFQSSGEEVVGAEVVGVAEDAP